MVTNFNWGPSGDLKKVLRDLSFRYWLQKKIAHELKVGRKEAHLTQVQVADALNICQSAVSKYEAGKVSPDLTLLLSFCYLYGWTFEEFLLRLNIRTKGRF
ncbi:MULTISPECIES: helix-turn-helix transcriptional regulator [Fructobacillus]|uniref:helix-turn-helix transcriptional regulator n=1 Tax=Fructobacillus TaxID=559173 RepID=UPI00200AB262|nr:helix-turn-helix transcriptional regulator [Fructobacillus cardui]MCK8627786.1 helix-turn-helix domain-containing protein [Fructobacillus cardui]CAK1240224.1 Transcriptional regulator [Fructobacillus cardui]CAK1249872.1 Transcriptional regulator [Fructobacillus tropaeoli]